MVQPFFIGMNYSIIILQKANDCKILLIIMIIFMI